MDLIQVKNFSKSFGGKTVHRNVNFSVHKGECLGLIGGSGVGKSVILRSLIGLEKPDSGQIFIEGQDITQFSEEDLIAVRTRVAYVFQGGALFDSMSVYENLAYPLREHTSQSEDSIRETIHQRLSEFGLLGSEKVFPAQLSGGMQKRVGLARAIILNPGIVLYDEPTAGLDPFNTIRIQEMILRLKTKGVTSVFVSHDMPSVYAVCDRIALLLEGEIKAEGRIDDLEKFPDGPLQKFITGKAI